MGFGKPSKVIKDWPEESREAAQLVIDTYGEPHEATPSLLIWHGVGPWKRMEASCAFAEHRFPAPHTDSVESFINYAVPPDKVTPLAEFDGSVIVDRTAGDVSARCHDEQANFLALNLMHDIVSGQKSAAEARDYYAKEFVDYRRKEATPYMEGLHFKPGQDTPDPDEPLLSDADLERATREGEHKQQAKA
jgi:hypothetical protein